MDRIKSQNLSSTIPSQILSNIQNNSFHLSNIQRMENNVQAKIFEMCIKIEQNTDLYNTDLETKNNLKNVRNKIIATSVVNKNSNLYNKILRLNKQKKPKKNSSNNIIELKECNSKNEKETKNKSPKKNKKDDKCKIQ